MKNWNVTWLGDGTYRFLPQSANNSALHGYNTSATVGGVETNSWTGDFNQEWVITSQGNNTYLVGPRPAWWRVLAVDETSNVIIINYSMQESQQWILTNV
jgi:hypothetical protein